MLVRLDKVKPSEHIYNIKLGVGDVENGSIIERTAYNAEDNYNGILVANVDNTLVMIVEPFLDTTGLEKEEDLKFKKDQIVRGYEFEKGDIITLTIDGITSATNVKKDMVGKFAIPAIGAKKLAINESKVGSLAFKIIDVDTLAGKDALVLEVQ